MQSLDNLAGIHPPVREIRKKKLGLDEGGGSPFHRSLPFSSPAPLSFENECYIDIFLALRR